jgi:hypothetical protein
MILAVVFFYFDSNTSVYSRRGDSLIFLRISPIFSEAGGKFYIENLKEKDQQM